MKFGLLYELEMLKPWYEGMEYDTYWQALAQVQFAEEMGFEYVWTVEHHFLTEFSHSSAPEVWYGALSQRTRNIRLGHGVVLLPYPFNHPIRVAERIAVLDILSNGRVEFGTGRSITEQELGGFGIDPTDSRPMWEEALAIIPRMWQEDPFSYEGRYFKIPSRSVIPKPIQKPHPAIWMATTQPESFALAGQKGIGVLGFLLGVEVDAIGRRIQEYRSALKTAKPVGAFINDQAGVFTITHCAESNKAAREHAEQAVVWYMQRSIEFFAQWGKAGRPVPEGYRWYAEATSQRSERLAQRMQYDYLHERDMIMVGDPETLIARLKRYEAVGVDQILMFMQAGRISHQQIMDSIKLIGKYVIPYFKHTGKR